MRRHDTSFDQHGSELRDHERRIIANGHGKDDKARHLALSAAHAQAAESHRRLMAEVADLERTIAENLAAGYSSVGDAMGGWKASAGHRRNLLNPNVTEIGIAAVATPPGSKHRNYWALILASPPPERVAAGPFGMEAVR